MNTLIGDLVTVARDVLQSLSGEESVFARVAVQERIKELLTSLFVVGIIYSIKIFSSMLLMQ